MCVEKRFAVFLFCERSRRRRNEVFDEVVLSMLAGLVKKVGREIMINELLKIVGEGMRVSVMGYGAKRVSAGSVSICGMTWQVYRNESGERIVFSE